MAQKVLPAPCHPDPNYLYIAIETAGDAGELRFILEEAMRPAKHKYPTNFKDIESLISQLTNYMSTHCQ